MFTLAVFIVLFHRSHGKYLDIFGVGAASAVGARQNVVSDAIQIYTETNAHSVKC